jgi:hypothetical protein
LGAGGGVVTDAALELDAALATAAAAGLGSSLWHPKRATKARAARDLDMRDTVLGVRFLYVSAILRRHQKMNRAIAKPPESQCDLAHAYETK